MLNTDIIKVAINTKMGEAQKGGVLASKDSIKAELQGVRESSIVTSIYTGFLVDDYFKKVETEYTGSNKLSTDELDRQVEVD